MTKMDGPRNRTSLMVKAHMLKAMAKCVAAAKVLFPVATAVFFLTGCQNASNAIMTSGNTSSTSLASESAPQISSGAAYNTNIASLTQVIKSNPQDASAYNLRGTANARARKYRQAAADFTQAIALNPQYYQAYNNRALTYVSLRQPKQAFDDYNRAVSIAPKYTPAITGRGKLHLKQKNFSLAMSDFSLAIEMNSGDPIAYYYRGLIQQKQGQHGKSIDDFNIAISLRPNAGPPYFGRGKSRLALGKFEDAYEDFYIAAHHQKGYFEAWAFRGLAAEKFGDKKKAARAYRRALSIKPSYRRAQEGLQRVSRGAA